MRILERYGWTRKAALLVMMLTLLSTSLVLLAPRKAEAACCGWREVERYYSDGTYTTQVGTCILDECAGTYTCTGDVSGNFIKVTRTCCDRCVA